MANTQRPCSGVRRLIDGVLALGMLCMCLAGPPATAQQAAATQPAAAAQQQGDSAAPGATADANNGTDLTPTELNQVTIVGSRIPRSSVETARPVITLSAKQIESTGLVNIGEILQHITSAGSAINSNVDVGGNGETNLDLRNLGPNRVLVLVNGKRWITGLSGAVDLDQIPTSVIDSVQVLKDGASSIYGSDAIAGVVNIITRKSFTGAEANAYFGEYNSGGTFDGPTKQYSAMLGYGTDKGNITFNAQYQANDAIPDCSRPISCVPYYGTSDGSSFGPNGRYEFYPAAGSALYNNSSLCPPNSAGVPYCNVTTIPGTPGNSLADFTPFTTADEFNYAKLYDLVAPNQSTDLYVQGNYSFTPHVEFHTTAMYNHHVNVESYSPVNLDIGGGGIGSLISASNPYNPFGCDLNSNVSAPSPGVCQLVLAGIRILAGGYREFTETANTLYYNGGLDGDFSIGSRKFVWNADYTFGQELEWDLTPAGEYNVANLNQALGPASGCTGGCVPMDFFGSGGITPAMLQYVGVSEQSTTTQTMKDYEVNLSSGDILDLPGGPLGFSIGAEYEQLFGSNQPDSLQEAGISTDGAVAPTSGGYSVKSEYAELQVPLLQKLPLVKEMDVDLAGRRSQFSSFGSNTTEQVGFRWQPDNQVLMRASWGTGFRAPDIQELFQGQTQSAPFVIDPCNAAQLQNESKQTSANCAAGGVPVGIYTQPVNGEFDNVTVGGNPKVQPEKSVSRSIGFVFNPNFLAGFDVNVDYFRINVNNLISDFGAQNILDACYVGGVTQFCNLVRRNAVGVVTTLDDIETNVGNIQTQGIDFGLDYAFNSRFGEFRAQFQTTFTSEYNEYIPNATGGPPQVYHMAGWEDGTVYGSSPSSFPKNKSVLSVDWSSGNWGALWRMRYIGSMIEDCSGFTQYGVCSDPNSDHVSYTGVGLIPTNRLGSTVYNDASVSYAVPFINSRFTLGANNLLNRNPPVSYSAHNLSFDPTTYDVPGRYIYARITAQW
jgi:outer membrane receptor protein involved in Fe transport